DPVYIKLPISPNRKNASYVRCVNFGQSLFWDHHVQIKRSHDHYWGRAGWAGNGLLSGPARNSLPHPGREHAYRRRVAKSMGLASPFLSSAIFRAPGDENSGSWRFISNERSDG